ncbi:serine hydrolase [Porcincola sp. LCP21S3_C12]|jgi:N-acetylmuramoyl-L-alanine amidase|uniref:serine hydrolase n=1 Tax=Porcincola sp. LCP21S3_C12 TaxID=3438798 RepID=UPI003F96EA0E
MRKKWVAAGFLLLSVAVLSSCGRVKEYFVGPQYDDTETAEDVLFTDTWQTEIGTESGTETGDNPDDDLVESPESESEVSEIIQESSDPRISDRSESGQLQETIKGHQSNPVKSLLSETEEDQLPGEGSRTDDRTGPFSSTMDAIQKRETSGEKWALAYEDLNGKDTYGYRENEKMQSASVIKLFIMGAVYRYICYPEKTDPVINFGESYSGQLRDVIEKMITVSDNDAANRLVEALGQGDFDAGKKRVNQFCREEGYTNTSLGRRFMAADLSEGDNYTSAADVRKFYLDLYEGKLVNEEASAKMLDILKKQTLTSKIPAGLPEGYSSGNKTGEMPDGYGLGCIENDSAIVFAPETEGEKTSPGYILVVLSNDLNGENEQAQAQIRDLSEKVASWYQSGDRNETSVQ